MKTRIIEVTQDDIDAGVSRSSFACPIAKAARREFGRGVSVLGPEVYVDPVVTGEPRELWKLSQRGGEFIDRFDNEQSVKPTRFRLTRVSA